MNKDIKIIYHNIFIGDKIRSSIVFGNIWIHHTIIYTNEYKEHCCTIRLKSCES